MIKEGYMEPRRCVSEKIDDKGEAVKQFERIEFAEFRAKMAGGWF